MLERWKRFLLDLVTNGRHETYDVEAIRKVTLLFTGTTIGIVFLLVQGTISYFNSIVSLCLIDYTLAFILLLILVYVRRSRNYPFGLYAVLFFFTLLCWYLLSSGGAYETGYVWYYTYPLIACFGLGARKGAIATAILTLPTLVLFSLDNPPGIIGSYPVNFKIRFVGSFLLVSALAYLAEYVREDTQLRLEGKNDELQRVISDLKLTKGKLRQAGEDLEKRVEERTRQLSDANRKLMEEMQERAQVEEALRVSEEKYRVIAENTADVISFQDMNLRYTYLSPSIIRLRGFTVEEAMEQTLDQVMTPESFQFCMGIFGEETALESAGTADPHRIRILELEQYKKDGSTMWIEVSICFVRDRDGNPVGVLSVSRDVTERRRAEEEKRRLEEQLREAQRLEAVGTLAGGIAHEFNNLLMGIQGQASLMLLSLDDGHPHHRRLKQIEQQVASGADLTKQLLGFAREGRYEVRPADMNEIIERTSAMFSRTRRDITILKRLEEGLWTVRVDRGQMEHLLMNLFVNAGQAMREGGTLTLKTENSHADGGQDPPFAVDAGKYVKLSIGDTGMGMDERTRKRIFDPFFTTKDMGRGAGLGLATVYGIVRGHRGMIDVKSEPGQGTTFDIYLPALEMETAAAGTAATRKREGKGKILLVDDEPMLLEVNRQQLEALGYHVYTAVSGQEALAVYAENQEEIALVILDMVMPGLSGGETFDRLRAINPAIRVLLSSGYSIEGQAQQILDRGCDGFLQKPFDFERLSREMGRMFSRREQH
ncbi:MAG: response regulator [Syntrophaceae bacterium]|nr:response regulator [Syntrophaceae bacterium]